MYGLLIQAAVEFLISKYGPEVAYEIMDIAENIDVAGNLDHLLITDEQTEALFKDSKTKGRKFFTPHQLYSDKLLGRIATVASRRLKTPVDQLVEYLGEYFVRYTKQGGYDNVLRMLGRTLREFIMGLDNLHEYFKGTYPKMRAPSFVVLQEDPDGMVICYRSPRGGFHGYVSGQLREVAMSYFGIKMAVSLVSTSTDSAGRIASIMKLEFDNSLQFSYVSSEKNCVDDISGRLLKAEMFVDLMPFFVAFNKDMEILSIGRGLKAAFPSIVGDEIVETFELLRPSIPCEWDAIMENRYNVFEIQSLKAVEREDAEPVDSSNALLSIAKDADFVDSLKVLRLRGQMVYFKEWDAIIFICMPLLESIKELNNTGLKLSEMSKTDCSRDLLTMSHNREIIADSLRTKELKLGAQIDYLTKEMAGYKAKRQIIIEEIIPNPFLYDEGDRYQAEIGRRAGVICVLARPDDLIHVRGVHPRDIIGLLNALFARIDAVIQACSKFCNSVLTTSTNHFLITGPPEHTDLPAHSALFVACEIADRLSDCTVALHDSDSGSAVDDSLSAFDAIERRPSVNGAQIKSALNHVHNANILKLDVRIGIDVGSVASILIKSLVPPRFVIMGSTVVRAKAVARAAAVHGIAWSHDAMELLEDSELREGISCEAREITVHAGFDRERDWQSKMQVYKMKSVNREVLTKIVKPRITHSQASSKASSRATQKSGGVRVYHQEAALAALAAVAQAAHNYDETGSARASTVASNTKSSLSIAPPGSLRSASSLSKKKASVASKAASFEGNDDDDDEEEEPAYLDDDLHTSSNVRCLGPAKTMCKVS